MLARTWRRACARVAWSMSSQARPWCRVTMASPIAAPYRASSQIRCPARSTRMPWMRAGGGERNRQTETRSRNPVVPPAWVPSRIPLPSSPGVPSGSPPRAAGACWRIIARLATNPPADSTTPARALTRSGRPYRRSSQPTGRCMTRPTLGAYRYGLPDQRCRRRWAAAAQAAARRAACWLRPRSPARPHRGPAAAPWSAAPAGHRSRGPPWPAGHTAAAPTSRARASGAPAGAGGAVAANDSSLPE